MQEVDYSFSATCQESNVIYHQTKTLGVAVRISRSQVGHHYYWPLCCFTLIVEVFWRPATRMRLSLEFC